MTSGNEPWQQVVADVYREWAARAPNPPAAREPRDPTLAASEEVLSAAGFIEIEKVEVSVEHRWTADDVVGYLFSTSYASRSMFGDLADEFADALRGALLAHDPSGEYRETLSAYVLTARKAKGAS